MTESNLTPEYIEFVKDDDRSTKNLLQQIIDRIQYLPGFLDKVVTLINESEDPFEEIPVEAYVAEDEDIEEIKATPTGEKLERRLKVAYCKGQ